jgi:hypothetical protein
MLVLVVGVNKNKKINLMAIYYKGERVKGTCYNCEEYVPSRNYCKYYQKELNDLTNKGCNR